MKELSNVKATKQEGRTEGINPRQKKDNFLKNESTGT